MVEHSKKELSMKRFLKHVVIFILVFGWAGLAFAAQIQWLGSLSEGLEAAKATQKPIMVEAYKDT